MLSNLLLWGVTKIFKDFLNFSVGSILQRGVLNSFYRPSWKKLVGVHPKFEIIIKS
jgi:hypothetical protein